MMTEDMCRALLENTSEIVVLFDAHGKIYYGNKSALNKLDYTEDKFLERNMSELFWQEFQRPGGDRYAPFDVELIASKSETAMYMEKSSCFPVSVHIIPAGGDRYFLFAEDITWKKNMDSRIRQLQEDEQTHLKVRNEFTANVTHELRTPVNGIKGHVTTLLGQVQDEQMRKTLDIILYCCDNMSAIINNILDFSKIEAGKILLEQIEFDFYKLMDQVIATHMAEINKKELGISVYIDENIPQFLIGDSLRIGQILNNLLSNAVKFTQMGRISVDVRKTMQVNDEIELFFMVMDTGIGISKNEQDGLFQSFKQVDASVTRRFGGTGLGLSITKQLVEMMGGSIHIESEKGKGSCFSFNIKLEQGQNASVNSEIRDAMEKWNNMADDDDNKESFYVFGSAENKAEIKKRLEKLILSIELGSWEKAEMLAGIIKTLSDSEDPDLKRAILRMEMAIRKEDYNKCMDAYEKLKDTLNDKLQS